ncbi:DUF3943 domain-containing protein [Helicobacter bizzozeronii]|uniref:DUF3943 domain-containing protein n=1 Tax=Helicobacter bizzozeronii TaxID=56877 RepID=UPI001F4081C7|nr:DUF3943 domain-containing protein [Helicobacter bizzozeronii]
MLLSPWVGIDILLRYLLAKKNSQGALKSLDSGILNTHYVPDSRSKYLGASVGLLGICFILGIVGLYLMPESVTHWSKEKFGLGSWIHNVCLGPQFDDDIFIFNWVLHPYFGAIYYMQSRVAGYRWSAGVLFTFLVSTFFWEYGLEAFVEIPSWQDLICTPTMGPLVGEFFYHATQHIQKQQKKLLDSKVLGHVALFAMDFIGFVLQNLGVTKILGIENKNSLKKS